MENSDQLYLDVAKYFSLIYYPKDTNNKNKFKFGKCIVNNELKTIEVIIYAKPRNNYFDKAFHSNEYFNDFVCDENPYVDKIVEMKEKTCCGGFRIKWNVLTDTFVYMGASQTGPCGCNFGGMISLFYSNENKIVVTDEYQILKSKIIKLVEGCHFDNTIIKYDNLRDNKQNKDDILQVHDTNTWPRKKKIDNDLI
jgi:hypothetical protein